MVRETLLDFFADVTRREGEFLVYDDGYRSRSWRYDEVGRAARGVARVLGEAGIGKGAPAEPKGVTIPHRNILANIVPIEREMAKYLKYARPFQPIRFLNLLPLSHMFGQAMATFVPPMLPGTVIFTRSYAPEDIVQQIRV